MGGLLLTHSDTRRFVFTGGNILILTQQPFRASGPCYLRRPTSAVDALTWVTPRRLECGLEARRAQAANSSRHVASMLHGASGSDWKWRELKGNRLQHAQHERG